jgi:uncharacterized protein
VDPYKLIEKYYGDSPALKEVLLVHSEQVRDRAMRILDAHPDWETIGNEKGEIVNREFLSEAAMLHDIGIIYCDAPKIHCVGSHKYIEHGYLGAELLRNEGLPQHAFVAERHTGSGITMEQVIREDLPIPVKDYLPESLAERIICYADKFYSKSHLGEEVSIAKIRENIWKYGHDAILRWERLAELMGESNG